MNINPILFFADRLPPQTGGMEMHARFFIEHFRDHFDFPLLAIVTRNPKGQDCLVDRDKLIPILLSELGDRFSPSIVFFNSGRWIEDFRSLRRLLPKCLFVYRTGGNEVIKASLEKTSISDHKKRQAYWSQTLNEVIDLLITNSFFTEKRLECIGVSPKLFCRCVGGVNVSSLVKARQASNKRLRFFCGARFVPYKNHALLLQVFEELLVQGHNFELRLAGDGPLFDEIVERASVLGGRVIFLGRLSNEAIGDEIARADYYVQFSCERWTPVEGGSYVHAEGMGRSVLEAISAGTYILALRAGALPEIVSSERGILFDIADPSTIAKQVTKVLRCPPPRPAPTEQYDWAHYFSRYERVWSQMCES